MRVLKMLGIEYLFVSNAGGGVNPDFHVGDVMVITDHINMIPNPLIGPNPEELGPRFPDMSEAYSRKLIALADGIAEREGIVLQHGCYWGGTGPTYETPAEYRFFHIAGADSVGMSTTPEVIAARHMGLPVFAVSVITNIGLSGLKSTHEEVQQEGRKAQQKMALYCAAGRVITETRQGILTGPPIPAEAVTGRKAGRTWNAGNGIRREMMRRQRKPQGVAAYGLVNKSIKR